LINSHLIESNVLISWSYPFSISKNKRIFFSFRMDWIIYFKDWL